MDCIFNKKIPKSTNKHLVLRPNAKTFVNGIASSYEIVYFEELKPYVREIEYTHHMTRIIEGLTIMWPCVYCLSVGYLCSLCTFGLSFCLPNICISEAVASFLQDIDEANKEFFNPNKLHLSLQRRCCTSWLQIDINDEEEEKEEEEKEVDRKTEGLIPKEQREEDIAIVNNQIDPNIVEEEKKIDNSSPEVK